MHIVTGVVIGLVLLALASLLSIYSYGRFAKRARGQVSNALPVEEAGTELDRMVAPILARHTGENGLMLLSGNLHAFAVRAHAARAAGRSLDLQYYYWRDDLTGGLLAKEVIAAAERGVRVRVLLDDINTRGEDAANLALDSHPNIEVRLFNPSRNRESSLRRGLEMLLRAFRTTRRMHNKAWIADGRMAVVGGRNIGDAYFDASETANFRDMDVLLLGPVVSQAAAIFDRFWNCAAAIPVASLAGARRRDLSELKTRLDARTAAGQAAPYLARLIEERDARAVLTGNRRFHWTNEAKVVSDPPGKAWGESEENWLHAVLFAALMSVETEMEITSPYFIPGERSVRELEGLVAKGVGVTVLTNSLAATDVAAVHGAYAAYRKSLLEAGVRLFELKPRAERGGISLFGSSGASLHTKAFTVDRRSGFVGSFNFDPRSASLNTEMGVLFEDEELAREIHGVFAEQIGPRASYRLSLESGGLVWTDGSGEQARVWRHEPEASVWRRLTASVIGLLPIESQL